jgi:hypothetical protein
MQPTESEKQKQKFWAKLGFLFTLFLALLCLMGFVQSVLLIGLSNEPQPSAWRNLIICAVGLLASFVGFIFFALAFRRATQNPLMYTGKRQE